MNRKDVPNTKTVLPIKNVMLNSQKKRKDTTKYIEDRVIVEHTILTNIISLLYCSR